MRFILTGTGGVTRTFETVGNRPSFLDRGRDPAEGVTHILFQGMPGLERYGWSMVVKETTEELNPIQKNGFSLEIKS